MEKNKYPKLKWVVFVLASILFIIQMATAVSTHLSYAENYESASSSFGVGMTYLFIIMPIMVVTVVGIIIIIKTRLYFHNPKLLFVLVVMTILNVIVPGIMELVSRWMIEYQFYYGL